MSQVIGEYELEFTLSGGTEFKLHATWNAEKHFDFAIDGGTFIPMTHEDVVLARDSLAEFLRVTDARG
jgi:hypothetical protein